jgi:hypothetical protein
MIKLQMFFTLALILTLFSCQQKQDNRQDVLIQKDSSQTIQNLEVKETEPDSSIAGLQDSLYLDEFDDLPEGEAPCYRTVMQHQADMELTLDPQELKNAGLAILKSLKEKDLKTFLSYIHREWGLSIRTSLAEIFELQSKDFKYQKKTYLWGEKEDAFEGTIGDFLQHTFSQEDYLKAALFVGEEILDQPIPDEVDHDYQFGNFVVFLFPANKTEYYLEGASIILEFEEESGHIRLIAMRIYDWKKEKNE